MNFFISLQKKRIQRDSKLAWVALVASIFILCSNLGFLWSFSLFYNSLLSEYETSKEKTAWLGSIPISLTFFLAPFPNWMSSKLGTRLSIIIGVVCCGTALFTTSFAKNIDIMFLSFSLLYGIGSATLNMCTIRAQSLYFDKRLSTALGLLTGGTALLQIALTQLIVYLLANYGLQKTFQIYAAISTIVCLPCSLVYFPPANHLEDDTSTGKNLSDYISLFKNKVFCIWIATLVTIALEHGVSMIHQVQVAVENGVPEKTAKQFPFYGAISSSIGRIIIGPFLDMKRFDKVYAFQGLLLSGAITAFIGSFATTAPQLIAFILIFSTIDGAFQSGVYPMTRVLIGLDKLSEAISILLTLSSITLMMGPPFIGFIVDQTDNYRAFFYVAGGPLILGCLLLFALRCMKYPKPSIFETENKKILEINDGLLKKSPETTL